MAVLIIVGSCATDKMAYVSKEYEFYDTWINTDYDYSAKFFSPKFIVHPNGKIDFYVVSTDTTTDDHGEFVITNKWTDSKGNIWYSIIWKIDEGKTWNYSLSKISNSGKTLEMVNSPNDYPNEINPNDRRADYSIYYRQ